MIGGILDLGGRRSEVGQEAAGVILIRPSFWAKFQTLIAGGLIPMLVRAVQT